MRGMETTGSDNKIIFYLLAKLAKEDSMSKKEKGLGEVLVEETAKATAKVVVSSAICGVIGLFVAGPAGAVAGAKIGAIGALSGNSDNDDDTW